MLLERNAGGRKASVEPDHQSAFPLAKRSLDRPKLFETDRQRFLGEHGLASFEGTADGLGVLIGPGRDDNDIRLIVAEDLVHLRRTKREPMLPPRRAGR